MESKVNFKYRLLGSLGIFFSFIILVIGLLFFLLEQNPSGMLVFIGVMFLWIGFGFLFLTLISMRTVAIEGEAIRIGTFFGIFKNRYHFDDIIAIKSQPFTNGFGSYSGLLLQLKGGGQVHIHEMEFRNFEDIKDAVSKVAVVDEKLKLQIWTTFAKGFVAIGGLIFLSFVIVKMTDY